MHSNDNNHADDFETFEQCLAEISGNSADGISECVHRLSQRKAKSPRQSTTWILHEKEAFMTCGESDASPNCNRRNLVDRVLNMASYIFKKR